MGGAGLAPGKKDWSWKKVEEFRFGDGKNSNRLIQQTGETHFPSHSKPHQALSSQAPTSNPPHLTNHLKFFINFLTLLLSLISLLVFVFLTTFLNSLSSLVFLLSLLSHSLSSNFCWSLP